jgi:F-box protein 18 (helicase)
MDRGGLNYFSAMQFTDEQEAVLASSGDIKINAVAGSGKTSVLIEYAKRRSKSCRMLYLAFNRSVRLEAQHRFELENVGNVDVQTAHSLAFRRVVIPGGYKIAQGYRVHEIVDMLGIRPIGKDPLSAFIIGRHILKFTSFFCNSSATAVRELDYCGSLSDEAAKATAKHYYDHIEKGTRLFLGKMDKKEIGVTHDFYLKKFQLSRPRLDYDTILFDEGQDASPVMLDVFLSQKATKVIVGDAHQQIYGWRHAINALKDVRFDSHNLTTSFRFNDHVAALAMECLRWKTLLDESVPIVIRGMGHNKKIKTRATIARSNLALLKTAIDAVQKDRSLKSLYFEGNLRSYTYAADGASIYDVLNLYLEKKQNIRDPLIASMGDFRQLVEYADTSEDMELGMLTDIVEAYGGEIPSLLKKVAALHVEDEGREKADMIFSTLHRCKGMEYDHVTLAEDFINEEKLRKALDKEKKLLSKKQLSEEINLAYVAVTRSKNFLDFPQFMFPDFDRNRFTKTKSPASFLKKAQKKSSWSLEDKRKKAPKAYMPWSEAQDEELRKMFVIQERSLSELAVHFDRNIGAIRSRLRRLGLMGDFD